MSYLQKQPRKTSKVFDLMVVSNACNTDYGKGKRTLSFSTRAGKIAESNKKEKWGESNLHPCFQGTKYLLS